jgi:hypothetical protein
MGNKIINCFRAAAALLAVGLLLLGVSGFVTTVAAAASVTVDESFDNYPTAALSGSNWNITAASGSIIVVEDPNNPSDKSVRITKTNPLDTVNADRQNLEQSGQFVIDYRVKSDETAGSKSVPYVFSKTSGTNLNLVSVLFDAGFIKAYNSGTNTKLQSFTTGTWYRIQLILDTSTNKYDVYIDGKLMANQFAFRNNAAESTFLRFALGTNQTGTIYFDDLKVAQLPASISMGDDYQLAIGHTHASTVTASYPDATNGNVTKASWYDSSNPSVAQVDAAGVVTARSIGTTIITAHYAGKATTLTVQVTDGIVLNSLQLDSAAYSLPQGSEHATVVTAVYSNGTRNVTANTAYTTGNPSIASVSQSGLVTGKSAGSTVISATYGGKTASAVVTVTPILTELLLDAAAYDLQAGSVHQTGVSAVYSNQTTTDVTMLATYMSSDSSVASVDRAGNVTGGRAGHTVITATYGGKSKAAHVSVSSIRLDSDGYELQPEATHLTSVLQLTADGVESPVTSFSSFSSSNSAVAQVDITSQVTGRSEGTAVITAVYGESRAIASVTVRSTGASSQITVPSAGKDMIQVHLWAQGIDNVYAAQSEIDFDPAILQLQKVVSGLFSGTPEVMDSHNSSYSNNGVLTGFQSLDVQGGHLSYGATQAGAGTSGTKPYVTLFFKVLNPSQDTSLQVNNANVTSVSGNTITKAVLPVISVTFDEAPIDAPDTSAPSDPIVSVTGRTPSSIILSWTAATDNVGVTGYDVYNGNDKLVSLTANANLGYTVTGLHPNTTYILVVKARDAAGNTSSGASISAKTSGGNQSTSNSGGGGGAAVGVDSGMNKEADKSDDRQIIQVSDLGAIRDGKLTIRMNGGASELLIPADALSLLGGSWLEIQKGAAIIRFPSIVIQSLTGLLSKETLQGAQISFKLSMAGEKDTEALLATALGSKEAIIKAAAPVLQLDLSIISKDGTVKKLALFDKPVEVSLPYEGGSDLNEQLLGVYYLNEQTGQWEYIGGHIDTAAKQIKVQLAHFSKYIVLEYNKPYHDVPSSHWAANAIQVLSARHIVNGINDINFAPQAFTTRAEFTTLLVRTLGLKASGHAPFQDVSPADWYAEAVTAAYESKLIGGRTEMSFAPQDQISREEMAAMLVRAYEGSGGAKPAAVDVTLSDLNSVSGWALGSVQAAASIGLMNGRGENQFQPNQQANRAETAQAVYNLQQRISR